MSNNNRSSILALMLMSLLSVVNICGIRQLTTQDTSVFSMVTRLRIPLVKQNLAGAAILPPTSVHGLAQIRTMGAFIIVTLSLSGLVPNTTHMASLQAGNCALQGPVLYALQPIAADAQGDAMTVTTLNVHTLTTTHIDITVHEAGTMDAMKTPQGFNSIACGDVKIPETTPAIPVERGRFCDEATNLYGNISHHLGRCKAQH